MTNRLFLSNFCARGLIILVKREGGEVHASAEAFEAETDALSLFLRLCLALLLLLALKQFDTVGKQ